MVREDDLYIGLDREGAMLHQMVETERVCCAGKHDDDTDDAASVRRRRRLVLDGGSQGQDDVTA